MWTMTSTRVAETYQVMDGKLADFDGDDKVIKYHVLYALDNQPFRYT